MTTVLGFEEIEESQSKKYLSHNKALYQIGAFLKGVKSKTTAAQPASPAEGDSYILPASPTGARWATATFTEDDIAFFYNSTWYKMDPVEGVELFVEDEDIHVVWTGTEYRKTASVFAINSQTGTTYTLALSDSSKLIKMDNAAANVVTIPSHATSAFDLGTIITLDQTGAGETTVDGEVGVTINGIFNGFGVLAKVASNVWEILSKPPEIVGREINTQTGTTYTLALSDAEGLVRMDNAAANTLTIPEDVNVAFPIGTKISVYELGAGATTVDGEAGVTLVGAFSVHAIIEKVDTDVWSIK